VYRSAQADEMMHIKRDVAMMNIHCYQYIQVFEYVGELFI
jgi:hypothetical protein